MLFSFMELTNPNYDNFLSVLSCIFIYYTILIFLYNGFTLFCFKKQKKVLFEHEEPESEPESEPASFHVFVHKAMYLLREVSFSFVASIAMPPFRARIINPR